MLNTTFKKSACDAIAAPFVVPEGVLSSTSEGNMQFDTGDELRLQSAFGEEVWQKLERSGLTPSVFNELSVLEVCSGTGYLTFHLLSRCRPKELTVNDISPSEMSSSQRLASAHFPEYNLNWMVGNILSMDFQNKFDVIIGNSFIHHFDNVPRLLERFRSLLNPGGVFISLHEPTPMSTVVEGGRVLAWPLAVLAPGAVNNLARARYKGNPSATDLWLFEPEELKRVAVQSGFRSVEVHPWGLFRPITVQRNKLHLSADKQRLTETEIQIFRNALKIDSILNRFLPSRCFGSISIVGRL